VNRQAQEGKKQARSKQHEPWRVNRQAQGGKKPPRSKQEEPWRVNRQAQGGKKASTEQAARTLAGEPPESIGGDGTEDEIVPFPFFMAEKAGVSWWFHFFFVPLHTKLRTCGTRTRCN
jgi:hypothetical protein